MEKNCGLVPPVPVKVVWVAQAAVLARCNEMSHPPAGAVSEKTEQRAEQSQSPPTAVPVETVWTSASPDGSEVALSLRFEVVS